VVAQGHAVPQDVPISVCRVGLLSVPTLTNHVLNRIDFLSAVSRVNYNMLLVLRRAHVSSASHNDRCVFVTILVVLFLLLLFSPTPTSHHETVHIVGATLSHGGHITSANLLLNLSWH
jgi:hypothetical protein